MIEFVRKNEIALPGGFLYSRTVTLVQFIEFGGLGELISLQVERLTGTYLEILLKVWTCSSFSALRKFIG